MDIAANIKSIKNKINNPAVNLVAAVKTQGTDNIRALIGSGINAVGENRVQEMLEHYDAAYGFEWHFIGQLQTNKVKYIIDKVDLIHSLDRIELAEEINKRAAKIGRVIDCLVEVNVGDESSKAGIEGKDVEAFIRSLRGYKNINIAGLMAVMPYVDGEELEGYYRELSDMYRLSKIIKQENVNIKYLSAGMSGDYETAIKYGANIIRLGTVIFGSR
jgi:hypothetical protein